MKPCCHSQHSADGSQELEKYEGLSPVKHVVVGGDFTLTDHNGKTVTKDSFRGRLVLIFFGFTHCKLVCPRALARICAALDLLHEDANQLQALYITVDPQRDTPGVLKHFLQNKYPHVMGLTGSEEQIESIKQKFKVFARQAVDADAVGGYVVPHTALTYLMGTDGSYLSHFSDAVTAQELASRIQVHLALL